MTMKYNRATTLFIRFIRENKISFRYKNELFDYLMFISKPNVHTLRVFDPHNCSILSYINGEDLSCVAEEYDAPLDYAMKWRWTASGDGYWREINRKWKYYFLERIGK